MLFFLHSPGLRLRVGADCLHCIAGNYVCCKKSKGCYTDKSYDHCHFFILLSFILRFFEIVLNSFLRYLSCVRRACIYALAPTASIV